MANNIFQRLRLPTLIVLTLLALEWYFHTQYMQNDSEVSNHILRFLHLATGISIWISLAWLVIRIIDHVIWPFVFEKNLKYLIPKLLKDIVRLNIVFIALGTIIHIEFDQSLTTLLAASGIAGLVLGFAVQQAIADFFSGILINMERVITNGDWIKTEDDHIYKVIEVNWRVTILETVTGNMVVIPNDRMTSMKIENYNKFSQHFWETIIICLDYTVSTKQALRLLNAAAAQAQASIAEHLGWYVDCYDITQYGVEYMIAITVPERPSLYDARAKVLRCIIHHLSVAGISPIFLRPRCDIPDGFYRTDIPTPHLDQYTDASRLLPQIALFSMLSEGEMDTLSKRMTLRVASAGDTIVEQGELGTSMYILAEGILYVYIKHLQSERAIKVGQLIPGEFFGEMSLLTGNPRTATLKAQTDSVMYEITKDDMELLLDIRPEIAEQLSQILAQRLIQNETAIQSLTVEKQQIEMENFSAQLLRKIRGFFMKNTSRTEAR